MKNEVDELLSMIADYVLEEIPFNEATFNTARMCLADALGCGILALNFQECTNLLGPLVSGTIVPHGARVPGTDYCLDPVLAAFNIGTMVRWLDYNDTWLAAEWGHPSDNLGGILAIADFCSQKNRQSGIKPLTVHQLIVALIKAYEIQGQIALNHSFNRIGFDHVILVKVATTAVVTGLLGGSKQQIIEALSQAFIDTGPLRTYRHAPCTGSRKSWAAGDQTARGVFLAMLTMRGEKGYAQALTAPRWGFYDVLFEGKPFAFNQKLSSYVMDNILFKISFPAEFHAQTAVEASIALHPSIKGRLREISEIIITTHESAKRIIDKKGPLTNPADRDHCLQYMVAVALIKGDLTENDYHDEAAKNPLIDELREKMRVLEDKTYSQDYLNPAKRSITNAIKIIFQNGDVIGPVVVEYPLGHLRRREEGASFLMNKFRKNLLTQFDPESVEKIISLFQNPLKLDDLAVDHFLDYFDSANLRKMSDSK